MTTLRKLLVVISVIVLHEAFMNSAGHRANILGHHNCIGVGVSAETKIGVGTPKPPSPPSARVTQGPTSVAETSRRPERSHPSTPGSDWYPVGGSFALDG